MHASHFSWQNKIKTLHPLFLAKAFFGSEGKNTGLFFKKKGKKEKKKELSVSPAPKIGISGGMLVVGNYK